MALFVFLTDELRNILDNESTSSTKDWENSEKDPKNNKKAKGHWMRWQFILRGF
jgi:hypothetical protein